MKYDPLEYVTIEITKTCNFRCRFCFAGSNQSGTKATPISIAQMEHVLDELKKERIKKVTLTGGEPLTSRQELYWFMRNLSDSGIDINLNSNLSLVDEEFIKNYVRYVGREIYIFTSMLSPRREMCDYMTGVPGSYERIIEGFLKCHDNGIRISVNFTLDQENADDINLIPDFCQRYHVDRVSISQVIPPFYDRKSPSYIMLEQQMKSIANTLVSIHKTLGIDVASSHPIPLCVIGDLPEYRDIQWERCRTGTKYCAINLRSGEVFACSQENRVYGNIYQDNLHRCWLNMVPDHGINLLKPSCQACEMLSQCGGECIWNGCIVT